jgi:hypothetical protein
VKLAYIVAERLNDWRTLAFPMVRISNEELTMRASHFALIAAMLAIPTVGYSQDNGAAGGPVGPGGPGGPVGPNLGASPTLPGPSLGSPYGAPTPSGPTAGYSGSIAPGQVVPRNVPVTPQGGVGTAYIKGQRVLVDPNTNRILRVLN